MRAPGNTRSRHLTTPRLVVAVVVALLGRCVIVPAPPSLSINDVSHPEGNSGVTAFTFTVTLSPTSTAPVTVGYTTTDGTATAPNDYTATSGTLTFPAGSGSQTITVNVRGDTLGEPDENFAVNLGHST